MDGSFRRGARPSGAAAFRELVLATTTSRTRCSAERSFAPGLLHRGWTPRAEASNTCYRHESLNSSMRAT
jgi:hypothetical protein